MSSYLAAQKHIEVRAKSQDPLGRILFPARNMSAGELEPQPLCPACLQLGAKSTSLALLLCFNHILDDGLVFPSLLCIGTWNKL